MQGLSKTQAHGTNEYDIRYHILKNPNFENEFNTLVYDFYESDETS